MPRRQKWFHVFTGRVKDGRRTSSSFYNPSLGTVATFDWLNRGMQTRRKTGQPRSYIAGFFSTNLRREK